LGVLGLVLFVPASGFSLDGARGRGVSGATTVLRDDSCDLRSVHAPLAIGAEKIGFGCLRRTVLS
jgi:hypothetical protein